MWIRKIASHFRPSAASRVPGAQGRGPDAIRMENEMAVGEAPVLEALADITAVSVARTQMDPASLVAIRLAALVAVDAPAASYLLHFGPAAEVGLTLEDAQDILVAVAPIVG